MGRAATIQGSFNAGELSPKLAGRVDVAKYGGGCMTLEGVIPLIQGPGQRASGRRFVSEVKDSADRCWLVKFEFNVFQTYWLEFGDQYIRFYTNHGQVVVSGVAAYNGATPYVVGDLVSNAGINYYCILATTGNAPPNATYWYPLTGVIYEIPSPYSVADLTNSDGTFALGLTGSNDVIYMTMRGYKPRKLVRAGGTNWSITTLDNQGGPFKPVNITATTVYASARTGVGITLTASTAIFQSSHIGSNFYLEQKTVNAITQWEPGKVVVLNDLRRSDGKNYKALNGGTTGSIKPIHTTGAAYDGSASVQWEFQDPGYGWATITAIGGGGTTATADVVSAFPDQAVLVANASTKWAFSFFSDVEGWPTHVCFFKDRLTLLRDQAACLSVSGDYENFRKKDDGGLVTAAQAIVAQLNSDTKNSIVWVSPGDAALLVGTTGGEFAIKPLTDQQAFGPDNVQAAVVSAYGSRGVVPARIGDVVLFVQKSGLKLRDMVYNFVDNGYKSFDQTTLAEHITKGGITQIAVQQEPNQVIWSVRADGRLLGMTYSREQYADPPYGGWHPHRLGGAAACECIGTGSNPAGDGTELWMIMRLTVASVTRRYVCYMERERRDDDDPEDAFYVDCGLTLDNTVNATLTPGAGATVAHTTGVNFLAGAAAFVAGDVGREIHQRYTYTGQDISGNDVTKFATAKALITAYVDPQNVTCTINAAFPSLTLIAALGWRLTVTTISGLSHLEGMTVDVCANGATHPQRVVTGGAITLQTGASKAHVGLPMPAKLQTMRLNAGAQDGTSQGKTSRVNKAVIRLHETVGLKYGPNFKKLKELPFRKASDPMDQPIPLFTGDKEVDWPGDYDTNPWLCFQQDDPLPWTMVGVFPTVSVQDRG